MSFNSQVVELSSTDLDNLFDAEPVEPANPAEPTEVVEPSKGVDLKQRETSGFGSIPVLEDDDMEPEEPTEPVDPKAVAEPTEPVEPTEPIEGEEPAEPAEPSEPADPAQVNNVLKNTVDFLVKSGRWVDFEGREDLEVTDEIYADLTAKQDDYRITKLFSEALDSTGEYGKAIMSHIKSGGNPDEIIDLFKEQKQLESISTDTEEGKQAVIEKYYKDILGWKPEKVERTVKRLIVDDEVGTEYNDVKDLYDEHYKKELSAIQEATKAKENEARQEQLVFANNIKNVLETDPNLTERDRQVVQQSIFNLRNTLPNGQKVNDFYLKFNQMKSDPKEYVDFVRYVMDKEEYKASLQRKEKTQANAAAFNFIKGGAAITKASTAPIEISKNPAKAKKGTDFSFALKQK